MKGLGFGVLWLVIAIACSGTMFGLLAHRAVVGAIYLTHPAALEAHWLGVSVILGILLSATLWLWVSRRCVGRRGGVRLNGGLPPYLLGFVPLLAMSLRPANDSIWNLGLALVVVTSVVVLIAEYGNDTADRGSNPPTRLLRCLAYRTWITPTVAAALALAVYLSTIAPSVVVGDSSEMQVVAHTLGIAHPTGYPLYTLLGKLFTWLPFGNVAYRVNLMSAVSGALAAGLMAAIVARLTRNWVAALVAALSLAFSRTLWSQAIIAEVYALHVALVLFVLAMLTLHDERWTATHDGRRGSAGKTSLSPWLLACLSFGMGLAHHRTMVLLAPALLTAWLAGGRRMMLNAKVFGLSVVAVLLPLVSYVYLPLRWPEITGQALNLEQFWWHVMGSGYGSALRWEALYTASDRYAMWLRLATEQFTYPGLVLAALGAIWTAWRLRRVFLVSSSVFIFTVAFGIAYYVPDVEVFLLPSHVILALWIGLGSAALIDIGGSIIGDGRWQWRLGASCFFLVIPLYLLANNWPALDRSHDWAAHDWGLRAMQHQVEQGAMVIADVDKLSPLRYISEVEMPGRGLAVTMPDTEQQCLDIIAGSLGSDRPTYLARFLPDIGQQYTLRSTGPLVRLLDKDVPFLRADRLPGQPVNWQCQPGLALVNIDSVGQPVGGESPIRLVARGDVVSFDLYWQSDRPLSRDIRMRLVMTSESGKNWSATQWRSPVQGMYPTWLWRPGEVVADYWELEVPQHVPPQVYTVVLEVGGSEAQVLSWPLIKVAVSASEAEPADASMKSLGIVVFDNSLAITGVGYDSPTASGATGLIRLAWQVTSEPEGDYLVKWWLADGASTAVAEGSLELFQGEYPTSRWKAGETYQSVLPFQVPNDLAPGVYDLRIGLARRDGQTLPASVGWPTHQQSHITLGSMHVLSSQGPLTNIDNKAILLRYDLERQRLQAGETLRVVLEWQCVSPMNRDYTVFLHLLDSENRVQAQIDRYPVNGTRPTSQWRQGETIIDVYEVALPADMPNGQYKLEMGLYLAATMERLPVVDEGLRPIDDHVVLGMVELGQ